MGSGLAPTKALRNALRKVGEIYVKEGWPPLEIWSSSEGARSTRITSRRWPGIAEYEEANEVLDTPAIHSYVINDIDPNLARYYDEHNYRVLTDQVTEG